MKKLLLVLSTLLPILIFAQTQLPNSGMENWQNVGTNTEEPTNWNSNETGGGFASWGPQTCFRATSPFAGTYCAEMRTLNYLGTPVNGSITTGRIQAPSTDPNAGYIETVRTDANFNAPFTGRPDSIVGYYKYTKGGSGSDYGKVEVILHGDYNVRTPVNAGSLPYVIGTATFTGPSSNVATWTRFSAPFNYVNGNTPMYALAVATASGSVAVATNGSILWVDEFSLIYNPITITTGTINPLIYYVSASQGASVSVPYTVSAAFSSGNIFTAELSNSAGSFAVPVSLGTLSSTIDGTISGTIPANTASGTGYRIRTTGSNPSTIGSSNVSDIEIVLVSNSIAPAGAQTVQTSTNGTALNITETAGSLSREWKYATVSGGPYSSFAPIETGTSYTPNFATAGTYFVVCETTYPNGIVVTTNEVIINVVGNSVAPSGSQSILVGVNGTLLTVTETPAGTAREWMYSTTPGGPYVSFGPTETGMTYMPNFAVANTYYVVCVSTISSVVCTSNEVVISVGTATLSTGTITGSPFEFSPNAPDAAVTVPYTVSTALGGGNVFTAQLSDAFGSFAAPVNIGSVNATTSGTINATILHTSLDGTGYRIRVVSSSPVILGSDNGTDLIIDQFDNSASPGATQNIMYGVNGTTINVAESQTSSRNWKYATVSGGPYTAFTPAETGAAYTPNFATPGTYYVVSVSENTYNDTVVSNEIQINVANGTNLNTSAVAGSPYYISPNAAVTDNIIFTSDIVFNGGNVFTAEISDASGNFSFPTTIGTLNGALISPVPVNIPNGLPTGSGYRIRVNSSSPATTGTDNGTNIQVVQFANSAAPVDTQFVGVGLNGNMLTVSPTHPSGVTNEWMYQVGVNFVSFVPTQTNITYTPNFATTGTYPVTCFSVNQWNDTVQSEVIMIYVIPGSGVNGEEIGNISMMWSFDQLSINMTNSFMQNPSLEVLNMSGQVIVSKLLVANSVNTMQLNISSGMYVVRITDGENVYVQKFIKP